MRKYINIPLRIHVTALENPVPCGKTNAERSEDNRESPRIQLRIASQPGVVATQYQEHGNDLRATETDHHIPSQSGPREQCRSLLLVARLECVVILAAVRHDQAVICVSSEFEIRLSLLSLTRSQKMQPCLRLSYGTPTQLGRCRFSGFGTQRACSCSRVSCIPRGEPNRPLHRSPRTP